MYRVLVGGGLGGEQRPKEIEEDQGKQEAERVPSRYAGGHRPAMLVLPSIHSRVFLILVCCVLIINPIFLSSRVHCMFLRMATITSPSHMVSSI